MSGGLGPLATPALLGIVGLAVASGLLAALRARSEAAPRFRHRPVVGGTDGYSRALEAQAQCRYSVLYAEARRHLEHAAIQRFRRLPPRAGWRARRRSPPPVREYHRLLRRLDRSEGYALRLESPGAVRPDALWRSRRSAERRAGRQADRLFEAIGRWTTLSSRGRA